MSEKIKVMNVWYNNVTPEEAAHEIAALETGKTSIVVTPNAEIAENCFRDVKLLEAVNGADYTLPDGIGVVLASKLCGTPLKSRAAGYDTALALLPLMARSNRSLYLLGSKPGIAERAAENIKAKNPGLQICGLRDGYFNEGETDSVIRAVNESGADTVFVALGSPKQELFMYENRDKIKARVMIGLGGTLDGFAGTVKRAPELFIKLNLEWFYRLVCQPSRLPRMMKLPAFVLRAAVWRASGRTRA